MIVPGDVVIDKRRLVPELIFVDSVNDKYIFWHRDGQRYYGDLVNYRKVKKYEQLTLF